MLWAIPHEIRRSSNQDDRFAIGGNAHNALLKLRSNIVDNGIGDVKAMDVFSSGNEADVRGVLIEMRWEICNVKLPCLEMGRPLGKGSGGFVSPKS